MATLKPASTLISSRSPIVDSSGNATFAFNKILQGWQTQLQNGLNQYGAIIQDIPAATKIVGRAAIGTILQFIDDGGEVLAGGIDFSRAYLNKDTDHIADGSGSPLAGGKVAFAAFVASDPVAGQTLRFNGTHWLPVAIAVSKASTIHQWLKSYDATTGLFTATQPAYTDLTGQIQFETNTANNSSQTKLNLIQGSNVTITDGGSGNITIAAATTTVSAYVVRFKSVDYHAVANDAVFCNTASSGLIVFLPSAAGNSGATVIVKKISTDTNRVTISPTGGDLIDGAAGQILALPYASIQFVSDGVSNWWAV